MKKLLVIAIAVIAVLAMAVPAMADDPPVPSPTAPVIPVGAGTGVTISGGSGDEPVIKCKWETTTVGNYTDENGDPTHLVPRTQVYPPVSYAGTQPIVFWVVAHDNPLNDISVVYVDVFHPTGPPEYKSWKFQVILSPYQGANLSAVTGAQANASIDAFNAAYAAGLVTMNDGYTPADVTSEIAQGQAYLWTGSYVMDYHQPFGCYKVVAGAIDRGPVDLGESVLFNWFDYLPVVAMEIDFGVGGVSYGPITTDGEVSGDNHFVPSSSVHPTLRNIGNTWFTVRIQQDDMGFGKDSGTGLWNVKYDARIGSLTNQPLNGSATPILYDPAGLKGVLVTPSPGGWTDLPGTINLCNTWKIDFSIHIVKAIWPSYSGTMWLQAVYASFTGPNNPHPDSGVEGV